LQLHAAVDYVRQHTDAALSIRYPPAVKADHAHELVELTQGATSVVPTKRNGRCPVLFPRHSRFESLGTVRVVARTETAGARGDRLEAPPEMLILRGTDTQQEIS